MAFEWKRAATVSIFALFTYTVATVGLTFLLAPEYVYGANAENLILAPFGILIFALAGEFPGRILLGLALLTPVLTVTLYETLKGKEIFDNKEVLIYSVLSMLGFGAIMTLGFNEIPGTQILIFYMIGLYTLPLISTFVAIYIEKETEYF